MASHGSERHDPPSYPSDDGGSEARLPDHVYRRRRLVALAVLVLFALFVVWAVTMGVRAVTSSDSGAGDEDPAPAAASTASTQVTANPDQKFADFTPRPNPSGSGSAAPSSSPSASSTPQACGTNLTVTASTDKETYAAKEQPALVMTLENTGDNPCTVNTGSKQMAFVVTSGSDTVFDSRHCAAPGEDKTVTLDAGQKETSRLTWNRVRTAEGCPAGQAEALAGYYNLTASLGEDSSPQVAFVLQ